MAQKTHLAAFKVYAGGVFKELYQRVGAVDLQNLAAAALAGGQLYFAQLVVLDALDVLYEHKRAGDFLYSAVFLHHSSSAPFSTALAISSDISFSVSARYRIISSSPTYLARAILSRTGMANSLSAEAPLLMASLPAL